MNVKKIIAREGLILLGFIFASGVIIGLNKLSYHIFYLLTKPRLYDDLLILEPFNTIKQIGLLITILGYPIYLLIMFIIWAIKTLKLKENMRKANVKQYITIRTIILAISLIIVSVFFIVRNYTNMKLRQQNYTSMKLKHQLEGQIAKQLQDESIRKSNEEYRTQEEQRLQRELAMHEEQIRLQKAAIAIQMMQSMPQFQYSLPPSYHSSSPPEQGRYTIYGVTHRDGNVHYGPTGYIEGNTIYGTTKRDGNIHYGPVGYIKKEE